MYHIESEHESLQEDELASLFDEDTIENSKILFELLQYMSFIIYTDDGTFKTSLSEYTKAYRLIQFFMKLKEESLFKYLGNIFQVFSLSQSKDELNLNLQYWCQKILSFSNVRKEYFVASFSILKNNSQGFGKELFAFEQSYLKNVLGGNNMGIHEDAKKIGDGVGFFCAELGDKDLLFKLRSVKNYKQLVSYFKDLKFSSLKNAEKARFSNEFNESLENLLANVEQNWEIARDYIAIYAINKFKTVNFAKSK